MTLEYHPDVDPATILHHLGDAWDEAGTKQAQGKPQTHCKL